MHPRILALAPLVLIALFSTAGARAGEAVVRVDCQPPGSGACAVPPAAPAPPAPPAPPAVPAAPLPPAAPGLHTLAPLAPLPALPPMPAMGDIPAPPPPPPLPAIPQKAHAACAGKADGAAMTVQLGRKEIMRGECERAGDRMVFRLQSYRRG